MSSTDECDSTVCTNSLTAQRACATCAPVGPHTNPLPLLVQCQSPLVVPPPACRVKPNQVLLAIECGLFFYWAKVSTDQDSDCDCEPDHQYQWLPVKCGECAPISFRQSQIFFHNSFTGVETVVGPTLDADCPGSTPKIGDYVIDCANHNLWLYQYDSESQTCHWFLQENCFGTSIITVDKSVSDLVYNSSTQAFELHYMVRVCNVGDRAFSSVTLLDNACAQAITAGMQSPTVTFLAPTDLTFVESTFASGSSNILVQGKPLAPFTCQVIEYCVAAPTWTIAGGACTAALRNTVTISDALTEHGAQMANGQTAQAISIVSVGVFGGQARLEKRFGAARIDNASKTVTSTVTLTVCNFGTTPVTLTSLIDDVQTALGSSAFTSPGNPSARWICGSGALPTLNSAYNGTTQTDLLTGGTFLLDAGQTLAVDFDLQLQQSVLSTLCAASPFVNSATLTFTDVLARSLQCTARDSFFCDACPQVMAHTEIEYIRFKKQRIDLYEGVPFNNSHQYEVAYEVSLKYTIANTGCVAVCDVRPYLNIEDSMAANGVVGGQRGVVFHQQVSIVDTFPGAGPGVTANGSFTGTANSATGASNRLIAQTNLTLLPGQGFNARVKYDYVPSNNSRKGVEDVAAPSCSTASVSGSLPATLGTAPLLVQYESVCQSGVQSVNVTTPLESRDCPAITLEKQTVQLMDLSDRFTHTTDVYFQVNAYATPQSQAPTFVAGPTFVPPALPATVTLPPPPTYDCYQATFKYKVTNSGNVPLDRIRICDNFFDQLIDDFGGGGGASPFCGHYVVCPPPVLVAGPATGDDGQGAFSGNGAWTGLTAGDAYLGGGDALLLPGTSIEFSVVVRFSIDPKITIRLRNDASVLARGPNEVLVHGESRGFIPIVGPSLCFAKRWAAGYPLQVVGQDGFFRGQLVYTVYNDGDRRALDVEIIDQFTNNTYTVTAVDNVATAPASTRQRVMPCSTISGESPTNSAWTGIDTLNPVNAPPLPYLDRSELFTVYTPTFTFQVNGVVPSAENTATVNSQTIYDNPALNTTKTLPQLRAYQGYSGVGDDLKFGLLCRHSTLDVDPANAFRDCPLAPQSLVSPAIAGRAQLVSATPGNVLYDVTFTVPYENSIGGSIVNVARVDSLTITSTTAFPAGVSSVGITFTDPSPVEAGGSATLLWTERIKWTGTDATMNPPSLSYLTYDIYAGNVVALNGAHCMFVGESVILPDPFIACPSTPQAPVVNPATVVSATPGAVQYDVTYQYFYANGNTPTQDINVTRTTASYPAGVTSVSLSFVDPSTVAANAGVLLTWTERVQWNGTLNTDIPPAMPQLTYDVQFTHAAGLNVTCGYVGAVVTLVNPIP